MAFGYGFHALTEEQIARRRHLLDFWANVAQASALFVILVLQARFLVLWVVRKWGLLGSPEFTGSPILKHEKQNGKSIAFVRPIHQWMTRLQWWAGDEVAPGWGTKGMWLGGAVWSTWLAFCAMVNTGDDYWHLTKRFGIIGASQLPLHYLLAVRSPYSPLQLLTRSSHEQLKDVHQVLGRIIILFFSLHAAFYLNGFVQMGNLMEKLTHRIIILGLISAILFNLIGTTALSWIRTRSYRLFYMVHIIVAAAVLPLLYFHVHHIRVYIWEALAFYVLSWALRFFGTSVLDGTVSLVPSTDLIRVDMHLSPKKVSLFKYAGQHVYLQIPQQQLSSAAGSRQIQDLAGVRSNPFSVMSIPSLDNSLVLVARAMKGNTKDLAGLAHSMSQVHNNRSIGLRVEGPYGASSWLPDLHAFDEILLVAGGVGATFIVPLWRALCMSRGVGGQGGSTSDRVRLVWAVRHRAETAWAFPSAGTSSALGNSKRQVEIYVTKGSGLDDSANASESSGGTDKANRDDDDGIEMSEGAHLMSEGGSADGVGGLKLISGRPRLSYIVDDMFAVPGQRVAVLTCGPRGMTAELRDHVGTWVKKGRDVFWHAEAFSL